MIQDLNIRLENHVEEVIVSEKDVELPTFKKAVLYAVKVLITGANGQLGRCLIDESKIYQNVNLYFKTDRKQLDITNEDQLIIYL